MTAQRHGATGSYNFGGQVVIVTGGSKGIGLSIAKAFAGSGASVVMTGRDSKTLGPAADEVAAIGSPVAAVPGDARDFEQMTALAAEVDRRFGRLDVLVNNAGGVFAQPLESLSPNGWRALVETNLSSVFYCSRACLPLFRRSGGGVITNIGSIAGFAAHPQRAAYGAAKAGVNALTMSMAHEWAVDNIRVNCVAPGAILTEASRFSDPAVAAAVEGTIPLGRLGRPEDVAEVCLFLASDGAAFVTGTTLRVDGGPQRSLPLAAEPGPRTAR
jgi:3-oxoacyl-[acyl-carrier protein] reductase